MYLQEAENTIIRKGRNSLDTICAADGAQKPQVHC